MMWEPEVPPELAEVHMEYVCGSFQDKDTANKFVEVLKKHGIKAHSDHVTVQVQAHSDHHTIQFPITTYHAVLTDELPPISAANRLLDEFTAKRMKQLKEVIE